MGALAPHTTPWIPEDDIVLTKAIEAGASLESLAKGAVQFSRRFTIRELQDRWHSLLYDPVISADASAHMIEFERNVPSKSIHVDNAKENRCGHGKRKAESVRTCYYAMRKRICNEPLNLGDFGFLVPSGHKCCINGSTIPDPDDMLRVPLEDNFGLEDAEFGNLQNVFHEVMENNCPPCGGVRSSQDFNIGQQNKLHDMPIVENSTQAEIHQTVVNNVTTRRDCSGVGKTESSRELSPHDLFVTHDIKASDIAGSTNHICSGYGGNQVFDSTIPDCATTFGHLQYSSPSAMTNWRTMGPISGSELPGDSGTRMDDQQAVDTFGNPRDDGSRMTRECEAVLSEANFESQMPNELKNSTNCDSYFEDLLELTRVKDILFTGVDGKDVVDMIGFDGLSSLLLNSPMDADVDANVDASLDQIPSIIDAKVSVVQESYVDVPTGSCAGQLDNNQNHCVGDRHVVATLEQIQSSACAVNSQFPELHNGVICCTMNTEDPDIPCNDDIVFPPNPWLPTSRRRALNGANRPTSSFPVTPSNQTTEGLCNAKRRPHAGSQMGRSKMRFDHAGHNYGDKNKVPSSDPLSMDPGIPIGGPGQSAMANKEASEILLARQSGSKLNDKSAHVSDCLLRNNSVVAIQEADVPALLGNQEFDAQAVSKDTVIQEPVGEPVLDPEEQFYESDADIPYFSDVESMVLEMDLGPDNHDLYSNSRVAKYQNDDAKRAIIRLEQGAHSYMQRAIASHGAFAILYGRHSRHYIKKPEVLLGRATDHVLVDIDLGREGRANKISRRQAIIKMERDGSFLLKNLGKFSLSINNDEVYPGQSLRLQSNCLIEIRGMPFIFETNQVRVRQYLDSAVRKVETKLTDRGLNT
ncbi:hypothetical protein Dimus_002674 [Dionaea muscipula]